ncbi:MAG: hypothetical protein ACQEQU_09615 [Spirochaetota bacterium]
MGLHRRYKTTLAFLALLMLPVFLVPWQSLQAQSNGSIQEVYRALLHEGTSNGGGEPSTEEGGTINNVGNTVLEFRDYPSPADLTLDYASGRATHSDQYISVEYQRRGGSEYEFFVIGMSSGGRGSFYPRTLVNNQDPEATLRYNLYNSYGNVILTLRQARYFQDLIFFQPEHQNEYNNFEKSFSFTIEIPENQDTTLGDYEDTVTLNLWASVDGQAWHLYDLVDIHITVSPSHSVGILIVGRGGDSEGGTKSYSMDFGTLAPGDKKQADVIAQSTVPYSISVASINGGSLKHIQLEETVPYTFMFTGIEYPLSSQAPIEVIQQGVPTGTEGSRFPFEIIIDEFEWKPAGDYSDSLTFQITAN